MRRMSFAMTEGAVRSHQKTVTRRLGWLNLHIGERLQAVNKLRARNAAKLAVIEVVSVRRERLDAITDDDVEREGSPFGVTAAPEFVAAFCREASITPDTTVTRIEFRYIDSTKEQG